MTRTNLITVRATTAEHEAIRNAAAEYGCSVSELVRTLPMLVDFWQDPDSWPTIQEQPPEECGCIDPGCPCDGWKRGGAP